MAQTTQPDPRTASVDFLVDERGSRIDVPHDSVIANTSDSEAAVGATSPSNWWMTGLIALAIVVVLLLALQIFGGSPGTDVVPGTPVAAPQEIPPASAPITPAAPAAPVAQ
jgi:hypothetical protein